MLDDEAMVKAAQVNPQLFEAIYEQYVGAIYGYCWVRLGTREAAEDATSEVFLKALTGIGSYRKGIFSAWLFRIAHNVVINVHRRRRPIALLDEAGDAASDSSPSPEGIALQRAEYQELRAALDGLTAEQRNVIELQLAGLTGDQIAAVMGKSPVAIRMIRYRAVAKLRNILEPRANEQELHRAE